MILIVNIILQSISKEKWEWVTIYKAYIISVSKTEYIGFIVNHTSDDGIKLYYNTSSGDFNTINDKLGLIKDLPIIDQNPPLILKEWAQKIYKITQGNDQDTSTIPLDLEGYTQKQAKVISTAQKKVPINTYMSYGELAELTGLKNAYRFVGTTMKICRQPYIVPCHRIKSSAWIKRNKKKFVQFSNKNPL